MGRAEVPTTGVAIGAIAHDLPSRVVTNQELIDTHGIRLKDAWVRENVGIAERRYVSAGEYGSTLATRVGRALLERAGLEASAIDRLIVATVSPDVPTPSMACIVQSELAPGASFPCVDLVAACGGFLYALDFGRRCVQTGDRAVLCIASEVRSAFLNPQDRRTVMLFGDGAAGVLLRPTRPGETGIVETRVFADGRFWDRVSVPAGGTRRPASAQTVAERAHSITMTDAAGVADRAITEMSELVRGVVTRHGLGLDDVDFFVFHQASGGIVQRVVDALGVPESKTWRNFARVGNTTAASVPIALSEAVSAGRVKPGDLVVTVATGGGFTAGVALVRWEG